MLMIKIIMITISTRSQNNSITNQNPPYCRYLLVLPVLAGRTRTTEMNFLATDTYGSLACEFSTLSCVFKDQLSVFADSSWDAKVCRWRLSGPRKRLRSLSVLRERLERERGWSEGKGCLQVHMDRLLLRGFLVLYIYLGGLCVWIFMSLYLCLSLQIYLFFWDFNLYPFMPICS